MKIFGLPVQFVTVVVVSAALVIYLLAAVADSRVEARTDPLDRSQAQALYLGGSAQVPAPPNAVGHPAAALTQGVDEPKKQSWETALLFVCPLH